ncbi:MAG TPA: DUF3060 domain-containing protein [Kofleriaceae bacterium]|nr:DUF3060 domain-containing protein [Kofleriaceae bacterium]
MKRFIPCVLIALLAPSVSRADRVITSSKITVAIDCGKEPVVQIVGNKNTVRTSGTCSDVIVDGNDNRVTVAGAAHVGLRGNHNTLDLAAVDALDVMGNNNSVQRTARTKVSDLGTGNTISLKK